MRNEERLNDPFLERIQGIMNNFKIQESEQDFRSLIRSEVRDYSQRVSDFRQSSQLFFKLCDLLIDCQSANLPEPAFRVIVANLVYEHCFTNSPTDDEIRDLTGLDSNVLSGARSTLMNEECLVSVFRDTPFTGIGGKKVARKKKLADLEEVTIH